MTTTRNRFHTLVLATFVLLAAAVFCYGMAPEDGDVAGATTEMNADNVVLPEPATLAFVSAAGLALFRRRRPVWLR